MYSQVCFFKIVAFLFVLPTQSEAGLSWRNTRRRRIRNSPFRESGTELKKQTDSRPEDNEPVKLKPNWFKTVKNRPDRNEHSSHPQYQEHKPRDKWAPNFRPTKQMKQKATKQNPHHQYKLRLPSIKRTSTERPSFTRIMFKDTIKVQYNPFKVNPRLAHGIDLQKRKGFLPGGELSSNQQPPRFGLLVQDPHASVYDIPTLQEVRGKGDFKKDFIEDSVNKSLKRRGELFKTRAKPRFGGGHKIFLMAGPPYPGPNPRNPALPLDKTVIYP